MGRPVLSLLERARGLLSGLAVGHALGEAGEVVRRDTPESPWGDEVALALLLGEELLEPEVDLRRLADRWLAWWRRDGRGLDAATAQALEYIALHDAPPPPDRDGAGGSGRWRGAPLARYLSLALPAHRQPNALVSATFHTVFLTHPAPVTAWAAVAINVAAACFLQARRDFVPDVIEALRINDAPAALLSRLRRVPFISRDDLDPATPPAAADPIACAETALWTADHEPSLERALAWSASRNGGTTTTAVIGGLLGARDGEGAIPGRWLAALPDAGRLRALAKHLVKPRPDPL